MKISKHAIGNRTRYLPACDAMPQSIMPPYAQRIITWSYVVVFFFSPPPKECWASKVLLNYLLFIYVVSVCYIWCSFWWICSEKLQNMPICYIHIPGCLCATTPGPLKRLSAVRYTYTHTNPPSPQSKKWLGVNTMCSFAIHQPNH